MIFLLIVSLFCCISFIWSGRFDWPAVCYCFLCVSNWIGICVFQVSPSILSAVYTPRRWSKPASQPLMAWIASPEDRRFPFFLLLGCPTTRWDLSFFNDKKRSDSYLVKCWAPMCFGTDSPIQWKCTGTWKTVVWNDILLVVESAFL